MGYKLFTYFHGNNRVPNIGLLASVESSDIFSWQITERTSMTSFDLFDDVSFQFHGLRWCNVVFLHKKTCDIHVNASFTKFLAGFPHVMAENWKKIC